MCLARGLGWQSTSTSALFWDVRWHPQAGGGEMKLQWRSPISLFKHSWTMKESSHPKGDQERWAACELNMTHSKGAEYLGPCDISVFLF